MMTAPAPPAAAWWARLLHRTNAPFVHPDAAALANGSGRTGSAGSTPGVGDFVDHFGLSFFWTASHLGAAKLAPLRHVGDPLLDAWLANSRLRPKDDPIPVLFPTDVRDDAAGDTAGLDAALALRRQLLATPAWVDWEAVRRGQDVFVRHAGGAGIALLNCSLVGGFGAPKINKVLGSTGYLARSCQTSYVRLFETLQMIVDCMQPGGMRPAARRGSNNGAEWGGVGWRACIRVRVLHGKVRRRLLAMGKWDRTEWGVPINQEDMCATLLSFAPIVLECLDFMKQRLSPREKEDYIHLWRLIGYYSGILEEHNPCRGGADSARAVLESIVRHIVCPDATSAAMSNHMLRSTADRPPLHMPYEAGAQLSRMLLGHRGADLLQMPPEHRGWRLVHGLQFLLLRWLSWMTRWPFGIGDRMMHAQRTLLKRVAVMLQGSGGRRTKFELKFVPDDKHFGDMGCPHSGNGDHKDDDSRDSACEGNGTTCTSSSTGNGDSNTKPAGVSALQAFVYTSLRLGSRVGALVAVLLISGWSIREVFRCVWSLVERVITF